MALGIAGNIREAGCAPGAIVAIAGSRCGDFIAGLLGVLLARCVAMPLDPRQPAGWRREALREAEPALILTVGATDLAEERCPRLSIDRHPADRFAAAPPIDVEAVFGIAALDDPAYLFFTSGTTGRTKGVLGSHGGLGHFLAWQRETFGVAPEDRVAHVTGLSFDVVLREIFVALTAGASLSIPKREILDDPREFTGWLEEEAITLLHAVPTVATAWLSEAAPETRFPRLRATFFAGEPLLPDLVLRWRSRLGAGAEIVNLYGPTETTLAKCWYRMPEQLPASPIPVGTPLPECEILLLDEAGNPATPGEAGEVAIRTPWRSLGYLHGDTPFRPGPAGDDAEDRLYPTGDRGRWLADGNLALLGRIDDQVKIRGVRVEPDGVAAVLAQHPAVAACAVLALPGNPQPRLTAFVVGAVERTELRRHLGERLADAMIPTEFVFLAELPCTANGKLDRARLIGLAAAPTAELAGDPPSDPPHGASERRIAAIYRELLGLPPGRPLSATDDFFDLGGDSLRALAVISRINQGRDGQLDVGDLFEAPDIRGLARRLDALLGTVPASTAVPLRPVPRRDRMPLSPAQERIWFQCQLEGEQATAYNFPVAIEIHGPLDVSVMNRAVQALFHRHETLRTTFPSHDGGAWQTIGPEQPVPLPYVDLGHLPPDARAEAMRRHAHEQAEQPFRIDRDRPLRTLLIRQDDVRHLLLLTAHHLVFDGWSRWRLIRELGEHYSTLARGGEVPPPATLQYADYAAWCRLQSPRPDSLDYWRRHLADAAPVELPCDFPRPALPAFRGARVGRQLPPEFLAALESLATSERATLYMLLLTGFTLVLSRWSGGLDLTVGSPVANRPHPELEALIGCFIETLPIRADLSGRPSCLEVLRRVRAGVIEAFMHADVPFERIVAEVAPPRRPGRHPLFDVMFNLVNVPRDTADPDGLAFSFAEWTVPEAKFDLALYARKKQGGLELSLVYKTALFRAERMERLLDAVVAVLRQIVNNPKRAVGALRIELDPPSAGMARLLDLPDPAEPEVAPAPAPVAPRDADEEKVAAVYRELLGRETVSIHDNFFALGGHSLLAAQAVSRLRRQFQAEIPLHLLFTCQTVAELTAAIRRVVSEREGESGPGEPLTLGQRRLLNFMAANPCSAHYNVPRKVLLRGPIEPDLLEQAIRRVASRHAVLSTGYRMGPGAGHPVSLAEAPIPFARVDVSATPDPAAAAEQLIAEEIARPFSLDAGPLLRATLIRTGEQEHILLVSVHHVSADCWSMGMPFGPADGTAGAWMAGVFFRQLWDGYRDLRAGRETLPPVRPHRFDDVARRQNAWLAGAEATRQLDYWRSLLADRPQALEIPPDLPRPPVWDFRGERLRLAIAPEVADALRTLARRHGTTLFVVLQAAFAALLRDLTGADDLITGTTASNRARWDADDLIGFFSNNLLLRTNLAGDPDFHELIRRSHTAAFAALAHQELPFERIMEGLGIESPADRHPLFQLRFLLHLPADRPFVDGDLSMLPMATGREVAKYDLTLLLADGGDTLEGWLEYATSLYLRATAEAILDRYRALLASLAAHPERPLSNHTP